MKPSVASPRETLECQVCCVQGFRSMISFIKHLVLSHLEDPFENELIRQPQALKDKGTEDHPQSLKRTSATNVVSLPQKKKARFEARRDPSQTHVKNLVNKSKDSGATKNPDAGESKKTESQSKENCSRYHKKNAPTTTKPLNEIANSNTGFAGLHTKRNVQPEVPHQNHSRIKDKSYKNIAQDSSSSKQLKPLGKHKKSQSASVAKDMKTSSMLLNLHQACILCGQSFRSEEELQQHWETKEQKSQSMECIVCQVELSSKHALITHLRDHNVRTYQCEQCEKIYFWQPGLLKHHKSHENIPEESAAVTVKEELPESFASFEINDDGTIILDPYLDNEPPNSDYTVEQTDTEEQTNTEEQTDTEEQMGTEEQMSTEQQMGTKQQKDAEEQKDIKEEKDTEKDIEENENAEEHKDTEKPKDFEKEATIKENKKEQKHAEGRQQSAEKCESSSQSDPLITCKICQKEFSQSDFLQKHKFAHPSSSANSTYPCTKCGLVYDSQTSLLTHEMISLPCEICERTFCSLTLLGRHKQREHVQTIEPVK